MAFALSDVTAFDAWGQEGFVVETNLMHGLSVIPYYRVLLIWAGAWVGPTGIELGPLGFRPAFASWYIEGVFSLTTSVAGF